MLSAPTSRSRRATKPSNRVRSGRRSSTTPRLWSYNHRTTCATGASVSLPNASAYVGIDRRMPPCSNRAACFIRLGEYENALADASRCVTLEPTNVKGWFRKGTCSAIVGRLVCARSLQRGENSPTTEYTPFYRSEPTGSQSTRRVARGVREGPGARAQQQGARERRQDGRVQSHDANATARLTHSLRWPQYHGGFMASIHRWMTFGTVMALSLIRTHARDLDRIRLLPRCSSHHISRSLVHGWIQMSSSSPVHVVKLEVDGHDEVVPQASEATLMATRVSGRPRLAARQCLLRRARASWRTCMRESERDLAALVLRRASHSLGMQNRPRELAVLERDARQPPSHMDDV